ncbi:MAG: class I SAM-dependent methyltransferase [Rhodospirillales bacterium]
MKQRFRMALSLLPPSSGRLLEIGYGSGIFMPALASKAEEVYGIDIHPHNVEVARTLANTGVQARLYQGTCERLPFDSGWFNAVVAVSALEFIDDLSAAAGEFVRVLAPGGVLVVVTPARSPLADAGLWLLTGKKAEDDFEGGREAVIPTLLSRFRQERQIRWPMPWLTLYTALRLRPPNG